MRDSRFVIASLVLAATFAAMPLHAQDVIQAMAKATRKPLMQLSTVEINLERTGCFGTCPSYGVQICGHDLWQKGVS